MRRQPAEHVASPAEAAALARRIPSFADFVDDALFHPAWGYYSRGGVRFGEGGHYDTYPLALSPLFGHMVAEHAARLWRRLGCPERFEICELGAGNGQLCLDTLLWVLERSRHGAAWHRFSEVVRYRIIERSPALIARQRRHLGPLADAVRWSRGDLSRVTPRGAPFAPHGLIVANEVLDCLPHHKLVPQRNGPPLVVFVVAEHRGRALERRQLADVLARARRPNLRWREVLLPIDRVRGLQDFVARHYPELLAPRRSSPVVFAAPRLEAMLHNSARCYTHGEALWIDYGAPRAFHLRAPEQRKVFAGPPRSGAGVFDSPGHDDVTFMVDFSVAARAATAAGWRVAFCGPQAELARRTRVQVDHGAVDLIVRHRALTWMLALVGAHPEQSWRRGAMTWAPGTPTGRVPVRRYVERSLREFRNARSPFTLLITRR